MKEFDTICAIATALGEGSIAIIRISGDKALDIVSKIFKPKSNDDIKNMKSYTMKYGHIYDVETNELIDEVIISFMKGPRSFTAEDVIEINCHGGVVSTNKVLETVIKAGARLAEPGEFTKRAFLNGRIDLSQAEAVIDVIKAKTDKAQEVAQSHLSGALANKIKELRFKITEVLAHLTVSIDFGEEDVEEITYAMLEDNAELLRREIKSLYDSAECGKVLRDGLKTVIVGKPNVGKSSILNALLEEEKAIVTNIPGTTRDIVEGKINLDGIILNIIDTAGIRKTNDIVEQIGVEKSLKMIGEADLIIYVLNNNEELTSEDLETINELQSKQSIIFINKNDLDNKIDLKRLSNYNIITGNTLNYEGLTNLKNEIKRLFNLNEIEQEDYTYLSNARQIALITKAKDMIENIYNNYENVPIDMFTIDLKNTYETLGEIIGATYKDDLLDELFSKFCLGK